MLTKSEVPNGRFYLYMYCLWCLVLMLPSGVRCVNITFNYGSITSDFSDRVCSNNEVMFDVNLESDLHCSYSCASDSMCKSFFYHHGNKKCVTCGDVYLNTSDLVSYTGMVYYVPENVMMSAGGWNDWSSWNPCSATCQQGTRIRTRTCNNTANTCIGDSLQFDTCNAFSCTPIASTCMDWATRGFNETRYMVIDPDGNATVFGSVNVSCDLDSQPGRALTVLHHDMEQQTRVEGYESCGSYEVFLTYTAGFEVAKKIADISAGCSQYVKWECYKADLSWPAFTPPCTAWRNRSMAKSNYFTGPYASGKYCQCGDQGNCLDTSQECNCDKQAPYLTFDDGQITLKSDLPIYSFTVGDTDWTKLKEVADDKAKCV